MPECHLKPGYDHSKRDSSWTLNHPCDPDLQLDVTVTERLSGVPTAP
jgi:hypothetical protein